MDAEQKRCSGCGETKSLDDFHVNRAASDGLQYRCKPCTLDANRASYRKHAERRQEYHRQWHKRNPEWRRGYRLKRRFGLTLDDYDAMLAAQGGGCAICGRSPSSEGRALHVDHDHSCCPHYEKTCGRCVRGLLCSSCNRVILPAVENGLVDRARDYLARGVKGI